MKPKPNTSWLCRCHHSATTRLMCSAHFIMWLCIACCHTATTVTAITDVPVAIPGTLLYVVTTMTTTTTQCTQNGLGEGMGTKRTTLSLLSVVHCVTIQASKQPTHHHHHHQPYDDIIIVVVFVGRWFCFYSMSLRWLLVLLLAVLRKGNAFSCAMTKIFLEQNQRTVFSESTLNPLVTIQVQYTLMYGLATHCDKPIMWLCRHQCILVPFSPNCHPYVVVSFQLLIQVGLRLQLH